MTARNREKQTTTHAPAMGRHTELLAGNARIERKRFRSRQTEGKKEADMEPEWPGSVAEQPDMIQDDQTGRRRSQMAR